MKPVLKARKSWQDVMQLDAAPERVFPLLCPVREYEWLEDWKCELLYSASGVAEDGCLFRTSLHTHEPMTWIVNRYEAPARIEFACFIPGSHTMRLKLRLCARGEGTSLTWTREFTATDTAGDEWVAAYTEQEHRTMMVKLECRLKHFLGTGTMLRQADSEVHSVQ